MVAIIPFIETIEDLLKNFTSVSSDIQFRDSLIRNSIFKKLLGIKIDRNLIFDDHIKDIFVKTNKKLKPFVRDTPNMTFAKE